MAINDALSTAVTALQAQSYALENISSNIANSQTTAYKSTDTSFYDMVTSPSATSSVGGVSYGASSTSGVQGSLVSNAQSTYMGIDGSGYFVVAQPEDDGSGFSSASYYTRSGDFNFDKDGHLVNGAGYALEGLPVNADTGEVSGSSPSVIQISNDPLKPKATTEITYHLNLPSTPATTDSASGGSDLYAGGALTNVTADQNADFTDQSISGGSVTVYDAQGNAVDVDLRWAKVADADPSASPPTQDAWNLYYLSDSSATGTGTEWTNAGVNYSFDSSGALTDASQTNLTLSNMTVNGTSVGNLSLGYGATGLTQYADANGQASVSALSQDGYAAGSLVSVDISDSGRVTALYSNGQSVDVAQVVVAQFNAASQLQAMGSGVYAATAGSGEAMIDATGTGIVAGALEASNTDITDEFSKLIITQQAYSAATRIVSTSDEMLKEALNMVR